MMRIDSSHVKRERVPEICRAAATPTLRTRGTPK